MMSLQCNKCGRWVDNVSESTKSVTCSYCTLQAVGMPEEKTKSYKPTGRPAGWHFMSEFVDKDGNVFHKGKEQPDLKGTLPPTKIKPKKKAKRRSKEEILLARHEKKKKVLKKAKKKLDDKIKRK